MTDRSRALAHYRKAIRALSNNTYDDLSPTERTELLRVLREEQRRLLRQIAADATSPGWTPRSSPPAASARPSLSELPHAPA